MRRLLTAGWICALTLTAQDQPVIRVNTRLVEVDVVVRGKNGPVPGLTKEDFTLLDKGKPQEIAVFSFKARANSVNAPTPLPPGSVTNRVTAVASEGTEAPAGATVLLVDRLNTAFEHQPYLRKQMIDVLASLKKSGPIAVYILGRDLSVVYDFTSDPGRLIRAAGILAKNPDVVAQPGDQATAKLLKTSLEEVLSLEEVDRRLTTSEAIDRIARHLQSVRGRKSLVWLSGNFPMTNRRPLRGVDAEQIEETAQASNDENMAIYPVDVKGLSAAIRFSRRASGPVGPPGADIMEALAKETGGQAFINSNDISGAIQQAMDDAEVTYTLGFYPSSEALDGKYHPIKVKVAKVDETKGADVRYREGYVASEAPTPQRAEHSASLSIDDIFDDPLDATGVGLAAIAIPTPEKPGEFLVKVRVNVADLHLDNTKGEGKWVGSFDLAIQVPSPKGLQAKVHRYEIHAGEAQLRDLLANGFVRQETIEAGNSGDMVRVVVQDRTTGAAGSVSVPLDPR